MPPILQIYDRPFILQGLLLLPPPMPILSLVEVLELLDLPLCRPYDPFIVVDLEVEMGPLGAALNPLSIAHPRDLAQEWRRAPPFPLPLRAMQGVMELP